MHINPRSPMLLLRSICTKTSRIFCSVFNLLKAVFRRFQQFRKRQQLFEEKRLFCLTKFPSCYKCIEQRVTENNVAITCVKHTRFAIKPEFSTLIRCQYWFQRPNDKRWGCYNIANIGTVNVVFQLKYDGGTGIFLYVNLVQVIENLTSYALHDEFVSISVFFHVTYEKRNSSVKYSFIFFNPTTPSPLQLTCTRTINVNRKSDY